jgi:hypothetical protein
MHYFSVTKTWWLMLFKVAFNFGNRANYHTIIICGQNIGFSRLKQMVHIYIITGHYRVSLL